MYKNISKTFLIVIAGLFVTSIFAKTKNNAFMLPPKKYIRQGTSAFRCLYSLEEYMRNSDFLSDEMKQACTKHPENFTALGQMLVIIVGKADRVENDKVEKAIGNLNRKTAQLQDFLAAYNSIVTYGEAYLENDTLHLSENEPTSNSFSWLELPHKSSKEEAALAISRLGKKMEWSEEKIKEEQEFFFRKVALLLKLK